MTAEVDISRTWVGVAKCAAGLPKDPEARERYLTLVSARAVCDMTPEKREQFIAEQRERNGDEYTDRMLDRYRAALRREREAAQ
ncbi:hypothetical protein [Algiphilus sp.]|uniref:hypothetical protein n=1 Tax=Algiphilus sp. TaxID=1872431 RepID=UPI003CCBC166